MLLNGHSPEIVSQNVKTLMAKGHDEVTATKHANAHAAANRAAHGVNKGPLDAARRNALSTSQFAEPEARKYPINDPNHARNALSRVSGNGTPAEKAEVRAAVHRKYPNIGQQSNDHDEDD